MWDERFAAPGYLFGTEPAAALRSMAGLLPTGSAGAPARVLCIADGDGRNAVWLAGQGFAVTAFDASKVGVDKARSLAAARGVAVDHRVAAVEDWDWTPGAFDAVVAVFIQFAPPALRSRIHAGIARTLRPGGAVLLHGYAPRQIAYGTGGPRAVENLYTVPALAADFPGWRVLRSADYDADLTEGSAHVGRSALVDFVAVRPGIRAAPASIGAL
ncbi:MAG: SAM-dependent methyltransferase [Gemmobacter sp.]